MLRRSWGSEARGSAQALVGPMGLRTLRASTTSWSMPPWLPACSGRRCLARRSTTPAGRHVLALTLAKNFGFLVGS
eukprot:4659309-Alexandrium_andersonii.AAC.1